MADQFLKMEIARLEGSIRDQRRLLGYARAEADRLRAGLRLIADGNQHAASIAKVTLDDATSRNEVKP